MCTSLDSLNEPDYSLTPEQIAKAKERGHMAAQVRTFDEERERGLVHSRMYAIKMERYRMALESPRTPA